MSLIFDRFPTRADAERFVAGVKLSFDLDGVIFDDNATAMEHDPFPWKLDPPIVHIDRPYDGDRDTERDVEHRVEIMVRSYGGTFAGT